ncbi:hypothetical protein PT2222_220024 [Paraburkholderia tropica]
MVSWLPCMALSDACAMVDALNTLGGDTPGASPRRPDPGLAGIISRSRKQRCRSGGWGKCRRNAISCARV